MLLSLIGAPNPTQHLISALQARTRSRNLAHTAGGVSTSSNPTTSSTVALGKDEDFYLALINEQTAASGSERTATATSTEVGPGPGIGAGREVVRLLSGDPSRGALSLDMEDSLRVGQRVQVSLKGTVGIHRSRLSDSSCNGGLPRLYQPRPIRH